MTEDLIRTADQCYFGYTNRGHGLLCASFDNKELLTFLSRVTDLPINKPADVQPGVFYGCHRFDDHLVFSKTFPDPQSVRSGMVFTHAIIVEKRLSESINDLQQLFDLFVVAIPPAKPMTLPRLILTEQNEQKTRVAEEQKLLPILYFFLAANEDQVLVMPLNEGMPELYIHLWNALSPSLRYLLTFRLTFNPTDIEPSNYQLYFTPTNLLMRWPQEMQYSVHREFPDKILSESVKSLLAIEQTTPFTHFIQELNFQIKDFKGFRLCELAFSNYKQITNLDTNKLIQLLRLILVLSPARSDGQSLKTIITTQLVKQLELLKTDTFLVMALANIEPVALENFPAAVSPKIERKLMSWWRGQKIELLEMIISRRVEAPASSWWLHAVDGGFEQLIRKIGDDDAGIIYQLWKKSETVIAYLWRMLKSTPHSETLMVVNLPKDLDNRTFEQLLPLVKQTRWLQFHASLVSQKRAPDKALQEQLAMTSDDKASLTIIANRFNAAVFIQTAITYNNPVLKEIALDLPVEMKDLTQVFKVENEQWQEFIQAKLSESIKQKREILSFQPIIDLILDGVVEDKYISNDLLSLIATTPFANISDYPKRTEVWDKLQGSIKTALLKATGSALLEHLTTAANLEPTLKGAMQSLNIAGDYMHAHSRSWPDILRIFEVFPSLPEDYLIDHIKYSTHINSLSDATRLGILIRGKLWRKSANLVYEKAQYSDSYKNALAQCFELLDFFRKMSVMFTFPNMPINWKMSEDEWLKNFETLCIEIYDDENEIRIIWKKAQGDVADLKSRESAKVIWHHALHHLKKGKMSGITFRKLLTEMIINVPAKQEQLRMLLSTLQDMKNIN